MMKNIILSNISDIPIYKQLYNHLVSQILNHELNTDDAIPSIRLAAKELRISVITVKRAWEDLERDGFIYTIPGKGSFVAIANPQIIKQKRHELLNDELLNTLDHLKMLGIEKELIISLIHQVYDKK